MLGGVDGGPWAVGGGLEVRLFFFGLFGESGEPPVPGLKSAAKVLLFAIPENRGNFRIDQFTDKVCTKVYTWHYILQVLFMNRW